MNIKFTQHPSQEYLQSIIRFDPETGNHYWKNFKKGRKMDRPIGTLDKGSGYYRLGIDYKFYMYHRIVFIFHHGDIPTDHVVDHIDGDPSNNHPDNLRAVTIADNMANRLTTHAAFGFGVKKARNRYQAIIKLDGKQKPIGSFDNPNDAHETYKQAHLNAHGSMSVFNRRQAFAGLI